MCLYVETCVLVGLDWVEPMMPFSLHITCSCIVHAYVLFHFLFWYSPLMVSLSLSLSDSLRMAPKRKSALSHNSFRFEESFDPTLLHVRFHDEKARQDFSENFPNVAFIWNTA